MMISPLQQVAMAVPIVWAHDVAMPAYLLREMLRWQKEQVGHTAQRCHEEPE
jgi:hypothetical protein